MIFGTKSFILRVMIMFRVLTSMANFSMFQTRNSVAFSNFENYEDALDVDKNILGFSEEVFGENHSRTFAAMENMAETWNNIGNYKRALELEEEVLQFRRENLGEEHPHMIADGVDFYGSLNNLQDWYGDFLKKLRGEYVESMNVKKIQACSPLLSP